MKGYDGFMAGKGHERKELEKGEFKSSTTSVLHLFPIPF